MTITKKRFLTGLFVGIILICVAIGCFLIHSTDSGKEPIFYPAAKVVSTWYSNTPYENVLTFYDDGSYTSSNYGSPSGTYTMRSETDWLLTDETGDSKELSVSNHQMSYIKDSITYIYFDSKDLLEKEQKNETSADYELMSLRFTWVRKVLSQGDWKNAEGHSLFATMDTISLDGKESAQYRVKSVTENGDSYDAVLLIENEDFPINISADFDTMIYTVAFPEFSFQADGSNFQLDS